MKPESRFRYEDMQSVTISIDQGSVERQRKRIASLAGRKVSAAVTVTGELCGKTAVMAHDHWAVATGQSQAGVHLLPPQKLMEEEFPVVRQGIGVARQVNGQEVRMEIGLVAKVHRTLEEHDPGGKKCSSGNPGGWGGVEPEDVRRESGGALRANPAAETTALGKAILAVMGPIIDIGARFGFRKGVKNVYPRAATQFGDSPLMDRIRAAMKVVTVIVLLCGYPPFIPPQAGGDVMGQPWRPGDVAGWQTAYEGTVDTALVSVGNLVRLDASQGPPPANLTLDIHLQGSAVGLWGYMISGEDSALAQQGPLLDEQGDTVWFLERAHARTDTGWFSVVADVWGGNWARPVFGNAGDSVATVRARIWMKP